MATPAEQQQQFREEMTEVSQLIRECAQQLDVRLNPDGAVWNDGKTVPGENEQRAVTISSGKGTKTFQYRRSELQGGLSRHKLKDRICDAVRQL